MIVMKEEKDERGDKEGNLSIGLAIMCLADFCHGNCYTVALGD